MAKKTSEKIVAIIFFTALGILLLLVIADMPGSDNTTGEDCGDYESCQELYNQ